MEDDVGGSSNVGSAIKNLNFSRIACATDSADRAKRRGSREHREQPEEQHRVERSTSSESGAAGLKSASAGDVLHATEFYKAPAIGSLATDNKKVFSALHIKSLNNSIANAPVILSETVCIFLIRGERVMQPSLQTVVGMPCFMGFLESVKDLKNGAAIGRSQHRGRIV